MSRRRTYAFCAAMFSAIAMVSVLASSASALSVGVSWSGDWNQAESEMGLVGKSGASMFRVPFETNRTNFGEGAGAWTQYDKIFEEAAKNGVTVLPILDGRMVKGEPKGVPTSGEKATWSAWAEKAVRRYGYNGGFWSSHPAIPYKPAIAWEIWNEPNNPSEHAGPISASEYGAFLAWAGPAVQGASEGFAGRRTAVLFGGLLSWGTANGYQNYLSNANAVPGASTAYTGLSLHPYELEPSSFPGKTQIEAFKATLNGARAFLNGLPNGAGKSIWITESGWPAEGEFSVGGGSLEHTESEQARLLNESIGWAKENAAGLNLQSYLWFNFREIYATGWPYHCGLRTASGAYRKAWYAFQGQTGAPQWPPLPPPAARFSAPSVYRSANGEENVFATTGGGLNHYARSNNGPWGGEIIATGSFSTSIAPVAYIGPGGTENVIAVSSGGINHYARYPGGAWSGEIVAAGSFTATPSVYLSPNGTENVVVNTGGGINRYAKAPGGAFGGEIVTGGTFMGSPSAYPGPPSGVESVVVNSGGGLNRYARINSGPWYGEVIIAGSFVSSPVAYLSPDGTENVVVNSGTGINRYARSPGGAWGGEVVAKDAISGAPAVYLGPNGGENVIANSGGGLNRYQRTNGGPWYGEVIAAAPFLGSPAAYRSPDGTENVFASTLNGINRYARSPGGAWGGEIVASSP